ncbi:hypothetical protein, partial [Synechococcus sp. R55.7]|uniref:hypothetical protein n=1 Tax=Synechococcus sp. R55.7 TaxID=2964500 RepID=UPI0039C379DD
ILTPRPCRHGKAWVGTANNPGGLGICLLRKPLIDLLLVSERALLKLLYPFLQLGLPPEPRFRTWFIFKQGLG